MIGAGGKGFALGLFGAGVSSALTVPFASALAVEDLLGLRRAKVAMAAQDSVTRPDDAAAPPPTPAAPSPPPSPPRRGRSGVGGAGAAASTAGAAAAGGGGGVCGGCAARDGCGTSPGGSARGRRGVGAQEQVHGGDAHPLARPVTLARLPFIPIPLAAQMVNGLLLPCVASSMWLCLNHPQIMPPQSLVLNLLMAPCVGMTVFLAAIVVASNPVGRLVDGWTTNYSAEVAGPIAPSRCCSSRSCCDACARAPRRRRGPPPPPPTSSCAACEFFVGTA